MTDLSPLIAKLETAEGPSRELDAEIGAALRIASGWNPDQYKDDIVFSFKDDIVFSFSADDGGAVSVYAHQDEQVWKVHKRNAAAYTDSIDAALTLIPDGWFPNFMEGPFPRGYQPHDFAGRSCRAMLRENMAFRPRNAGGIANTMALALCIAALKARHSVERAS